MTLRVQLSVVASLVAIAVFAACSPLPGNTVDPMYLKVGPYSAEPSSTGKTTPPSAPAPATKPSTPPSVAARDTKSPGAQRWAGRYRDSRGEGDITFDVVRSNAGINGTWRSRAGGGGPIQATAEANTSRLKLEMRNAAAQCPGTFDGWAEIRDTALVGAYHGTDCEGPVSDGWLELQPR